MPVLVGVSLRAWLRRQVSAGASADAGRWVMRLIQWVRPSRCTSFSMWFARSCKTWEPDGKMRWFHRLFGFEWTVPPGGLYDADAGRQALTAKEGE